MKAKHLNIPADKDLYKSISLQVNATLDMDKRKANQYFILKALFYLSVTALSYISIFLITNPLLFILNLILFGFIAVLLCFNFAHDLSHNAIFRKPFLNNMIFEFIYTLVGAHPEAWKNRHLHSHHFAPNVEHFDTDLAITGLIRVLPNGNKKWYHKYQHIYATFAYMSYSFYWVFIKDFMVLKKFAPKKAKHQIRYYLTFVVLKSFYIIYLLILPILFAQQPIWVVITAFLTMHMIQSVYTLFLQHFINFA